MGDRGLLTRFRPAVLPLCRSCRCCPSGGLLVFELMSAPFWSLWLVTKLGKYKTYVVWNLTAVRRAAAPPRAQTATDSWQPP